MPKSSVHPCTIVDLYFMLFMHTKIVLYLRPKSWLSFPTCTMRTPRPTVCATAWWWRESLFGVASSGGMIRGDNDGRLLESRPSEYVAHGAITRTRASVASVAAIWALPPADNTGKTSQRPCEIGVRRPITVFYVCLYSTHTRAHRVLNNN